MQRFMQKLIVVAAATFTPVIAVHAQRPSVASEIRGNLRNIPEYGVFDLITFNVSADGSVTLGGYVLSSALKKDAEKSVQRAAGVDAVENRIEIAPVSLTDDNLRDRIFGAIYHDPFLTHYGVPDMTANHAIVPWGDDFRGFGEMNALRWTGSPFFGQEPVGNYAVHILVKHGDVTLAGVVDNTEDKTAAGRDAKSAGARSVSNDLHVRTKK